MVDDAVKRKHPCCCTTSDFVPSSFFGPSGHYKGMLYIMLILLFIVHNIYCSSRKEAYEKAKLSSLNKQEPIFHIPVDGGPPHYHPVGAGGKKKPGVHYCFPKSAL
jgi:hypothetical protein